MEALLYTTAKCSISKVIWVAFTIVGSDNVCALRMLIATQFVGTFIHICKENSLIFSVWKHSRFLSITILWIKFRILEIIQFDQWKAKEYTSYLCPSSKVQNEEEEKDLRKTLPIHFAPLSYSLKPGLHLHLNPGEVLIHFAFMSQSCWLVKHSLISRASRKWHG